MTQDLEQKQEQLRKYEEQVEHASTNEQLLDLYQRQVLSFLEFLSVMKGRYHEASFKEKRNALAVLGVTVAVYACDTATPVAKQVETTKEWLSLTETVALSGIPMEVLRYRIGKGELATYKRDESLRCRYVNRDELNGFLSTLNYVPRQVRENVQTRAEIRYSPIFSGVQSSLK